MEAKGGKRRQKSTWRRKSQPSSEENREGESDFGKISRRLWRQEDYLSIMGNTVSGAALMLPKELQGDLLGLNLAPKGQQVADHYCSLIHRRPPQTLTRDSRERETLARRLRCFGGELCLRPHSSKHLFTRNWAAWPLANKVLWCEIEQLWR